MGSGKNRHGKPSKSKETPKAPVTASKWGLVGKVWFWILGLAVASVGAGLSQPVQKRVAEFFESVMQSGSPVKVLEDRVAVADSWGASVAFPTEKSPTSSQVSEMKSDLTSFAPLIASGGYAVHGMEYRLVLASNRPETVRIVNAETTDLECSGPINGTLFYSPPAGMEPTSKIFFDLDEAAPRPVTTDNKKGDARNYFSEQTISLSEKEQTAITVVPHAEERACTFRVRLSGVDSAGQEFSLIVPQEHKDPLRVSAFAPCESRRRYEDVLLGGVLVSGHENAWTRLTPEAAVQRHLTEFSCDS